MIDQEPGWSAGDALALSRLLLADTLAYGVVFMDEAGVIRGLSRGAQHITGYAPAEVIGQPLSVLYTPEDRDRGLEHLELRAAREVGMARDERWHVRRDGGRVWTTGACLPLHDATGRFTGYVKLFNDATHLRTRMKYLENVVQECSLREERQVRLLGSIAHELRNPLAPLRTGLRVLRMQVPPGTPFEDPLQIMERQVGFIERMIEDLVDLTRVHAGKLSVRYGPVVLQALVAEAWEACRQAADAKGVRVQQVFPSVPLEVEADRERMLQVVVNLLTNAIKFTPPGGHVWISLTADQTHFMVEVRDTGQGIGADLLPKVFDAFTQADGAATHRGAGVGLGLAVVKEIVSVHAGTVEVRSEGEGKGSEFIVRIPLQPPHGQAREPMPRNDDGAL